jgi:hypothetical protein
MDHTKYTFSNQHARKRTNWDKAVRYCLREQPLYKSEYNLYSNGYREPIWYHTRASINKKNPVVESVRQKWQYHILKYLETKWIENPTDHPSEGIAKQEPLDDDLINIHAIPCSPEIAHIIKNKKIKIEYEE